MNEIQDNFDAIHSFFIGKMAEDKASIEKNAKDLFALTAAYNRLCKAYEMPIKHSITI